MGTLRKYEVQPGEPKNEIREDVKGSKKLAAFGRALISSPLKSFEA